MPRAVSGLSSPSVSRSCHHRRGPQVSGAMLDPAFPPSFNLGPVRLVRGSEPPQEEAAQKSMLGALTGVRLADSSALCPMPVDFGGSFLSLQSQECFVRNGAPPEGFPRCPVPAAG